MLHSCRTGRNGRNGRRAMQIMATVKRLDFSHRAMVTPNPCKKGSKASMPKLRGSEQSIQYHIMATQAYNDNNALEESQKWLTCEHIRADLSATTIGRRSHRSYDSGESVYSLENLLSDP